MRVLPYRRYEIRTSLNQNDALQKLTEAIQPPLSWWRWSRWVGDGEFYGKVAEGRFRCIRYIAYRNSFIPIVRGEVVSDTNGGSIIRVTMRMYNVVTLFCTVWLAFFALGMMATLLKPAMCEAIFCAENVLIPMFMLAVFAAMMIGGFSTEANKAERFLYRIFPEGEAQS